MTPAEIVAAYLDEKRPAWRPGTVERAIEVLGVFLRFVPHEVIEPEHVLAYVTHARSKTHKTGTPLAQVTVQGRLAMVRRFLQWAVLTGHVLQDMSKLIVTKATFALPRTLGEDEVRALIDRGAQDVREKAMIEILYGTGLRAGELCRLEPADVDLHERLVFVRQGKGSKDRVVPFGEHLREAVLAYLRQREPRGGPLFFNKKGWPLRNSALDAIVRNAGRRAGLQRPASPHRLRHSYATHLLRNGADIRHIQLLMGHASLRSTQVYLGIDTSDLHHMIERSHPLERADVK